MASTVSRAIGWLDTFFTSILSTTVSPSRLVTGLVNSTFAAPRTGGLKSLPARIGLKSGAAGACADAEPATRLAPTSVAAKTKRARIINPLLGRICGMCGTCVPGIISKLHFAVPILRFGVDRPEDFHVPFAAAPRLDDLGRDDVDQELREEPSFRVALEMIGRIVPPEIRIERQGQEQVVSVVDDDQLSAGALERRMVDEVLLRAVRADVALQREF